MSSDLSQEVHDYAQRVTTASGATLAVALNDFIGRFVGWPFKGEPGFVQDHAGNKTEAFTSVIYTASAKATGSGADGFPADAVAAVVDACECLDLEQLRAAYGRIAQAKRLSKSRAPRVQGVPITTVILGIIFALRSELTLEALGDEVDRMNLGIPGGERTDMIVVAPTGAVHYAVQFPGEGISGDFLPPGDGALEAYTPPMYIVMVIRPTGAYTLNKMMAFLIAHLAIFSPGAKLPPWIEMLKDVSRQAVTLSGYQYNQRGELLPVPRQFYNDRYMAPLPVRLEDQRGNLLSTLQFLPWQDGGAILLKGKLPLERLLIFLGKEALGRSGVIKLRDAQISYILPITHADFVKMLARIQRQLNMIVRRQETNWVVKKYADEGSRSPFISRLFSGMLRLRDAAIPDPKAREGFDRAYDVVLTSLFSAREAMRKISGTWEAHALKVASGEIAHLEGQNIHIEQNADKELGQETDAFLNGATRALKQGMQGVTAELGINIGFVFQKEAWFDAGLAALEKSDQPLAEYMRQARLWSERLVGCRNAVEHEGWRLPDVNYTQTDSGVKAVEPLVDDQPVSIFVKSMFDRLICFVEDVTVHSLQRRLPTGVTFTEVAQTLRSAEMPERFRMTLANGGMPPWKIVFHTSSFEET
jgi:hypothetical protein